MGKDSPYKIAKTTTNNIAAQRLIKANKDIEAQNAYNQSELSMHKTAYNGSAGNAQALLYRQKHKKE